MEKGVRWRAQGSHGAGGGVRGVSQRSTAGPLTAWREGVRDQAGAGFVVPPPPSVDVAPTSPVYLNLPLKKPLRLFALTTVFLVVGPTGSFGPAWQSETGTHLHAHAPSSRHKHKHRSACACAHVHERMRTCTYKHTHLHT